MLRLSSGKKREKTLLSFSFRMTQKLSSACLSRIILKLAATSQQGVEGVGCGVLGGVEADDDNDNDTWKRFNYQLSVSLLNLDLNLYLQ